MSSYEQDKRAVYERRRNLLYLISNYLSTLSLHNTNTTLLDEAQLTLDFEVCDNVDLDTIYLEFCSYQQIKFGKVPKIVKKCDAEKMVNNKKLNNKKRGPHPKPAQNTFSNNHEKDVEETRNFIVTPIITSNKVQEHEKEIQSFVIPKPMLRLHENYTTEWGELADTICRDLIKKDLKHSWNQVKGVDSAIKILKESVIVPLEYPHLFVGVAKPWKCVLLHGPPGTGKTLLARTLSSETKENITFFNISASTIISKWRGESEKLIRVLYDVAKYYAPSIIFIDEFDGLASRRDSCAEHEASKRFKNEFLALIDGLDCEESGVFLLASTNMPWEIDPAFLRRFEKKILIGLPDTASRIELINEFLPVTREWDYRKMNELAELSSNFTGDEIRVACKEASMMTIRKSIDKFPDSKRKPETVKFDQLRTAFHQIQPISINLIDKHREWNKKFGNQL